MSCKFDIVMPPAQSIIIIEAWSEGGRQKSMSLHHQYELAVHRTPMDWQACTSRMFAGKGSLLIVEGPVS